MSAATHRWVTCRINSDWSTAQSKHLLDLRTGSQGTTLCGASGMGDGVWFANQSKPECNDCLTVAKKRSDVVIRPHMRNGADR